jgi:hypothetical protein
MAIAALQLLRTAEEKGWSMWVVDSDEEDTRSAARAWEYVNYTGESWVVFRNAKKTRMGLALLIVPSPRSSCDDDETIVDYTVGNPVGEVCDHLIEEIL